MATMKTLNGYGFNATEFNGKTSDSYLLKTDTVANSVDSQKLGGKAPEYYIQPRNLLDNSDFIHPVNQRRITSADVSAWTYFIDRWKVEDNTLTISVETDGIHLTASSGAWFAQWIQMSDNDVGKTFTLAYGLSDGSIIMASGTMLDNVSGWTEFITGSNDAVQIRSACFDNRKITVGINPKSNIVLKWAALYEGSYTADTLPPYVPKGYAAELAECQRYYQNLKIGGAVYKDYIGYRIPIIPIMRINPTIMKSNIQVTSGSASVTAGGYTAETNCIRLDAYISSSTEKWWADDISLSADL